MPGDYKLVRFFPLGAGQQANSLVAMSTDPTPPRDPDNAAATGSSLPAEFESALSASTQGSAPPLSPPPPPGETTVAGPAPVEPGTVAVPGKEEKNWAAAVHGAGAAGLLCHFTSIPFLNIVVPLVVWLMKRNEMPFVKEQGKEVLNFQISWTLYGLVAGAAIGLVGFVLTLVFIGIFILWGLVVLGGIYVVIMAVLSIIGTVNASDGKVHRYPATIRFLK